MTYKIAQKRYVAFFAAVMTVLMVGAVSAGDSFAASPASSLASAKITPGQAATIGVNYIGALPSQLVTVDYDNEDGEFLYGVEIHKDGKEFDVKVDPRSGNVLRVEEDSIEAKENESEDNAESNDGKSVSDGDGETNDDNETEDSDAEDEMEDYFISTNPRNSLGDAIQIAMDHVGTDLSNLVDADVDRENNSFIYSIDFIIGDEDISVEIDPHTGHILNIEREDIGYEDPPDDDQ